MSSVDEFFREIDRRWTEPTTDRIPLNIIGSGALLLQAQYERGTRDSDVLETESLTPPIKDALLALAGRSTKLAAQTGMYLDIVPNGFPFLPRVPDWRPVSMLQLEHFEVSALAVVDVIVSKLKRFSSNDADDADAMIKRGLVDHAELVTRFQSAFIEFSHDNRATDLERYVANLNRVERDMLNVPETEFDLTMLRY